VPGSQSNPTFGVEFFQHTELSLRSSVVVSGQRFATQKLSSSVDGTKPVLQL
jgi:hypothetical protein